MHTSELLKHIYDINLSYLLLAQRLIVQDKASAMFRLGINEEMATTRTYNGGGLRFSIMCDADHTKHSIT